MNFSRRLIQVLVLSTLVHVICMFYAICLVVVVYDDRLTQDSPCFRGDMSKPVKTLYLIVFHMLSLQFMWQKVLSALEPQVLRLMDRGTQ